MYSYRVATRVSRNLPVRSSFRQIRHETTTSPSSSGGSGSSFPPGAVGGLVGGGAVFLAGYTYYHFSGESFETSLMSYDKTDIIQAQKL